MIKKLSIALLVLCSFCLVGCNVQNADTDSENNENYNDDYDGGPGGRVVRNYNYDNFEEYNIFYNVFCKNNQERYLIPENNDLIEINYFFNCIGVYSEIEEKGDSVDYDFVFASFQIEKLTDYLETEIFGGQKLEFQACDIADKYDYVCNYLSEISYRVNKPDMYEHNQSISIVIGDIELARTGIGISNFIKDKNFNTVMDIIISAYKGGI